MTSSNGNIFRVIGHLCGEFTGQRWLPRTQASDAELWCFFYLCLNKRLSKQSWDLWFKTPSRPLWRHSNAFCWNTGDSKTIFQSNLNCYGKTVSEMVPCVMFGRNSQASGDLNCRCNAVVQCSGHHTRPNVNFSDWAIYYQIVFHHVCKCAYCDIRSYIWCQLDYVLYILCGTSSW